MRTTRVQWLIGCRLGLVVSDSFGSRNMMVFLLSWIDNDCVNAWVWGKDKLGHSFELVKFEIPEGSMTIKLLTHQGGDSELRKMTVTEWRSRPTWKGAGRKFSGTKKTWEPVGGGEWKKCSASCSEKVFREEGCCPSGSPTARRSSNVGTENDKSSG